MTHIGKSSVGNLIKEVAGAIVDHWGHEIRMPQSVDEWVSVETGFEQKKQFRALGAIDGKVVRISCPPNSGSVFYCRKGYFGISLIAVCDADCRFTYVNIGSTAASHDSRVFTTSEFGKALENNRLALPPSRTLPQHNIAVPSTFLADSGFALKRHVMRPFAVTNSRMDRVFNYRLSRARMTIECAFGQLASEFPILYRPIDLEYETSCDVIHSMCILHNVKVSSTSQFIRKFNRVLS